METGEGNFQDKETHTTRGGHATIWYTTSVAKKRYTGTFLVFGLCDVCISMAFAHPTLAKYEKATFANGVLELTMKRYRCDLWEYFERHRKGGVKLSGRTAAVFIRDIATAVSILHSGGVVHGDIKTTNVLIDDGPRVVLADFGTAFLRGGSIRRLDDKTRYSDVLAVGQIAALLDDIVADEERMYHEMVLRVVEVCKSGTGTARDVAVLSTMVAGPPPRRAHPTNTWELRDLANDDTILFSALGDIVGKQRLETSNLNGVHAKNVNTLGVDGKIRRTGNGNEIATETDKAIVRDLFSILRFGPYSFSGTNERLKEIATVVGGNDWKLHPKLNSSSFLVTI